MDNGPSWNYLTRISVLDLEDDIYGCIRPAPQREGSVRHSRHWIMILLLVVLLSACAIYDEGEQQVRAGSPPGQIAATDTSRPNQVSGLDPTETEQQPESTIIPTSRPPTKAPTYTPEGTATGLSSLSTATQERPCYKASFIQDVTYRDGARISPGEVFLKIWRFRNEGSCSWDHQFILDFVGGERFSGPDEVNARFFEQGVDLELRLGDRGWNQAQIFEVSPGETAELALVLRAPLEEGRKLGFWRILAEDGETVVLQFYVDVDVSVTLEKETGIWSGEWQHDTLWSDAAGNPLVLQQDDRQIQGYYYTSDGEIFLIDASLSPDKTRMQGSFGQAWQNGWPFVLKLFPNQNVFNGYYNDSDFTAGGWCGSRQGYAVPLGECLLIE